MKQITLQIYRKKVLYICAKQIILQIYRKKSPLYLCEPDHPPDMQEKSPVYLYHVDLYNTTGPECNAFRACDE